MEELYEKIQKVQEELNWATTQRMSTVTASGFKSYSQQIACCEARLKKLTEELAALEAGWASI